MGKALWFGAVIIVMAGLALYAIILFAKLLQESGALQTIMQSIP